MVSRSVCDVKQKGAEMNAKSTGWMVALVARFGADNVRVRNGMVEKRGVSVGGREVWHVMGRAA